MGEEERSSLSNKAPFGERCVRRFGELVLSECRFVGDFVCLRGSAGACCLPSAIFVAIER